MDRKFTITFSMDEATLDKLEVLVTARKMNRSAVVRELVNEAHESYNHPNPLTLIDEHASYTTAPEL